MSHVEVEADWVLLCECESRNAFKLTQDAFVYSARNDAVAPVLLLTWRPKLCSYQILAVMYVGCRAQQGPRKPGCALSTSHHLVRGMAMWTCTVAQLHDMYRTTWKRRDCQCTVEPRRHSSACLFLCATNSERSKQGLRRPRVHPRGVLLCDASLATVARPWSLGAMLEVMPVVRKSSLYLAPGCKLKVSGVTCSACPM